MPIRFSCEQCGQKLKVSSKKAGQSANCPKCDADLVVPSVEDDAARQPETEPDGSPEDGSEELDPFAEFAVYDDIEWVYESDEPAARPTPRKDIDVTRVAVPRTVLYTQGILLAVVALISFILGVMVGSDSTDQVADAGPSPCVITGAVRYAIGNQPQPDDGSVVIALPVENRPAANERAPIVGLRPGEPDLGAANGGLLAIRAMGGAYARTDVEGNYELRLPDAGHYFVLVISRNAYRDDNDDLDMTHLAQLGRYVIPATDLLEDSKYEWKEVAVRRDDEMDFVF